MASPLSQTIRQHAATDRPLTQEEIAEADVVAQRLRGELLRAIEKRADANHSVLALARDLNLNRNVCQRIVAATDSRLSSLETLVKLPGPDGLMLFAAAIQSNGDRGKSTKQTALVAAIEGYQRFIRTTSGSQARLIRRVEASLSNQSAGQPADNVATRRQLYEVARDMLGYSVEVVTSVTALRPIPDSPEFTEGINAYGLLGARALTAPVPLVSVAHYSRGQADNLAEEMHISPLDKQHPSGLNVMEEFCTKPLPESVVDYSAGCMRTVVEPAADRQTPTDFVMGRHWRPDVHPALQKDPVVYQNVGIHRPAQRLVLDVYLHRSMAAACVPAIAAYLWHPGLTGNPTKHWNSRLPGKFTLELLGAGIHNAATSAWPLQQRLTTRCFELAGWDGQDFVGYRCDVEYPTWASVYYMMFDFSASIKKTQ